MKTKVIFVHHAIGVGGAPISMIETINGLDHSVYDVEVLLIKNSRVAELLTTNGIKFRVVDHWFYKKYYRFFPHIVPDFFRWYQLPRLLIRGSLWLLSRFYFSHQVLRALEYDIVHFNSSVLADWLCAGRSHGKTVIHVREPLADGYVGLRKAVIRREMRKHADRIIAISRDNAARVGLESKTTVVYNFTPIPALSELAVEEECFGRVLYVGGDTAYKGFLTAVGALDKLANGIKIIFCGYYQPESLPSSWWPRLLSSFRLLFPSNRKQRAAICKVNRHPNAEVVGLTLDVGAQIRRSALLINPFSLEHFARPIIEAFAYSKPVIATRIPGMSEMVDDGINGILVEKDSPGALASAINYLVANPELMREMGRRGREKAKLQFSPENVKEIEAIYARLRKC